MKYDYGVLPKAMKEGHILLLDEITTAEPGILLALQAVLEPKGRLVLTEKGGEVIMPHPDFRVVATDNTLGTDGTTSPIYAGRNNHDASLLDRFPAVINMAYLPVAQEIGLITDVET